MSSFGYHGIKRVATSEAARAERAARERSKIEAYRQLCQQTVDLRRDGVLDADSLAVTTALLNQNPEFYTVWNFRREILQRLFADMDVDAVQASCEKEIKLTESLLRVAPKSYWVWNHRRWTLETMPRPSWERELKLIGAMLEMDARNFHVWDYRRYVAKSMGNGDPKAEFDFTTHKINQNFSNFSAWHYRSQMLPKAFADASSQQDVVLQDFELVRNAIYTEPADQSAWLYQRWLLGQEPSLLRSCSVYVVASHPATDDALSSSASAAVVVTFPHGAKLRRGGQIVVTVDGRMVAATPATTMFGRLHAFLLDGAVARGSQIVVEMAAGLFGGNKLDVASVGITTRGTVGDSVTRLEVACDAPANASAASELPLGGVQGDDIWAVELASLKELVEIEPDSKCKYEIA
ncbi:hypothetical protein HK105_203077 [Polyrhizophydium stewartii]|uniref:Geranylgeranyl transferase type-2 subunit alpha n=1 Tax=Polyrhizophydium stewartii TaxID=2732419 RepID=A0ABR4ND26_9FUNG